MGHSRVLLHERAFPAVLEINAVRIEVPLGGDHHHLRHSASNRSVRGETSGRGRHVPTDSDYTPRTACGQLEVRKVAGWLPHLGESIGKIPANRRSERLRQIQ